ncbi:hypothetical protein [Sphingobium yanoikuyae]|jgi:hypothetical protein|nr:hypothetical protein [Sphingobium yanoikuyae]WBQ18655.1 hypothetical protein PAE53_10940 [Sphingobium yanoikuyae]
MISVMFPFRCDEEDRNAVFRSGLIFDARHSPLARLPDAALVRNRAA